ncbi:MAG: TAXI family TRAP transporter solute-binding subunit [Hyphomicrobiales bacterium]|nr:TAXI family TRAP transporter solute-binding subunit [Hyphomicrobiales bacterium]
MLRRLLRNLRAAPAVALAATLAAVVPASQPDAADKTFLTIAATGQSSSLYAYHVAQAQMLNKLFDDLEVTVMETGGGVDNRKRLARKEADWGLFAEPEFFEYQKGVGPWKGQAQPEFRLFWVTSPLAYYVVVNADSDVKSISDLTGKEFSGGSRGSSTERVTRNQFALMGVSPKWFSGSYGDARDAMKDRRIVGLVKAGLFDRPDGLILDAGTAVPLRFVSYSKEEIAKVQKTFPHYQFVEITPPYKGAEKTVVRGVFIAQGTTTRLPEELGYRIFKAMVENQDTIAETYPAIASVDIIKNTLKYGTAPLHIGVYKYLTEKGHTVPEHMVPPEAKKG